MTGKFYNFAVGIPEITMWPQKVGTKNAGIRVDTRVAKWGRL